VHGAGEPGPGTAAAGPGALHDREGHAHAAYGIDGDTVVVIRPDNHVGLISDADDRDAVRRYLRVLDGVRGPDPTSGADMVDGTRKG